MIWSDIQKLVHRFRRHRGRVHASRLWDQRDYYFCECGAVFYP